MAWSSDYNYSLSPEQNGFTAELDYGSPAVTIVTTGPQSGRRVEINSNNGSRVYRTTNVPSIDSNVGITAEAVVAVSGSGDAGFQAVFLDFAVELDVYADRIRLVMPGPNNTTVDQTFNGLNNTSNTTVRITVDSGGIVRVYRNGTQLGNGFQKPSEPQPSQIFYWWGEGGGTQTFRGFKFFTGGAVGGSATP